MYRLKKLWDVYQTSRVPYLSETRIREIGNKRLRKIVEYAYRTVPYYHRAFRQLKLRPTDIQCTEDLEKLPRISKADIQQNPKDFISQEIDISQCRISRSSGATGAPADFYYDQKSAVIGDGIKWRLYSSIFKASRRHLFRRGRVAFIGPEDSVFFSFMQLHRRTYPIVWRLLNIESRLFYAGAPAEKRLAAIREFRPNVVISGGSYLEILARQIMTEPESFPDLRVVVFSGDYLRPAARRFIEEVLECKVFGVYGAAEASVIGFECEAHRGYHLNTDAYAVSLVRRSGEPVEEMRKGQIVISNLTNKAMVLLNYLLGDIAEWGGGCACGRNLPMISDVLGRINDFVVMPNGELVSPFLVERFLRHLNDIKQFRVIQHNLNDFLVKIVPHIKANQPALSLEIVSCLKSLLGSEAEITVHYVEDIPRLGGKARIVISKVPVPDFRC